MPVLTRYILRGRIVTMDDGFTVIPRGALYVDGREIKAIQPAGAPLLPGWEDVQVIQTRGTIYPGLIDLHNHLSYNILPLWNVPRRYANRDQWGSGANPDYRKIISGPMSILGRSDAKYVRAIVRYAEAKCVLGGVTTSQGIELFSNQGIGKFFQGVVRNVEQTNDPSLPEAVAKISDVEATSVENFRARLSWSTCMLLHLSEGKDVTARRHFLSLKPPSGDWAITGALTGIHCAALHEEDFAVLASKGGAMIWSPLSNLLLYGATADITAAKRQGVRIGIGADWTPSGSKSVFGELKVARAASAAAGSIFTDREIVAMATRDAAGILRWQLRVGSLGPGKLADLLVLSGTRGDPYAALLEAQETDIHLVVIDGRPHYGTARLMRSLGSGGEAWRVGKLLRWLDLTSPDGHDLLHNLSLADAREDLMEGMSSLPELARELEAAPRHRRGTQEESQPLRLALDHDESEGWFQRTYFEAGADFRARRVMRAPAEPLSQVVKPIELDSLTVADDSTFHERLQQQRNLPAEIKAALAAR